MYYKIEMSSHKKGLPSRLKPWHDHVMITKQNNPDKHFCHLDTAECGIFWDFSS